MSWCISLGKFKAESPLRKLLLASLSFSLAIVQVLPYVLPFSARAEINSFEAYAEEMERRPLIIGSGPFSPAVYHEAHSFLFAEEFDNWRLGEAKRLPPPIGGPINRVLQSAIDTDLMCGDFANAHKHLKAYLVTCDPADFAGFDNALSTMDAIKFWARAADSRDVLPILEKCSKLMLQNLSTPGEKICSYNDVFELGLLQLDLLERANPQDSRLQASADRLYGLRSNCSNNHLTRLLAAYFYRLGQYQKAKQILLDWMAYAARNNAGRPSNAWLECLSLKDNFVLAQINLKMANYTAAKLCVDKAERYYNLSKQSRQEPTDSVQKHPTTQTPLPAPSNFSRAEVDELLPVASDIADLRRAVAAKSKLPVPKFDNYKSKSLEQIAWYKTLRSAADATRSDNDALVKMDTSNLIALYKRNVVEKPVYAGELSWFDAMLTYARLLSDQGYSDLSNQVLNSLTVPESVHIYVEAERAVNSFRSGKAIDLVSLKKAAGKEFSLPKVLRCLGLLYSNIGDKERATLFLKQSIALHSMKSPPSKEDVLFHLDFALLNLRDGNVESAFNSALRAQSTVEAMNPARAEFDPEFAKLYRAKVSNFLRESLAHRAYLESKGLAERVRDNLTRPALYCGTDEGNVNGAGDKANALIDGILAEIYFQCGDVPHSLQCADKALAEMKLLMANGDADLVYLKAMCSALIASPAAAASAYKDVPEAAQGSHLGFYYYPHLNELYLRYLLIAKGFADKAKDIDPQLKKRIDDGVKQFSDEIARLKAGAPPPPPGVFAGCGNAAENVDAAK